MMGLFSIFTGIIYNDCFSKSFVFSFKKSLYKFVMKPGPEGEFAITKGYKEPGKAFLFGMDPVSFFKSFLIYIFIYYI